MIHGRRINRIIFTWKELLLLDDDGVVLNRYEASCNVRNELNGRRRKNEVVYTYPSSGERKPYYPRQFPSGIFLISGVEYTDDPEYKPVKIKTTASREVFTWKLDKEGNYFKPTDYIQEDTAYWLHYTKSPTTLGCIRIGSEREALELAELIEEENKPVYLEVL